MRLSSGMGVHCRVQKHPILSQSKMALYMSWHLQPRNITQNAFIRNSSFPAGALRAPVPEDRHEPAHPLDKCFQNYIETYRKYTKIYRTHRTRVALGLELVAKHVELVELVGLRKRINIY